MSNDVLVKMTRADAERLIALGVTLTIVESHREFGTSPPPPPSLIDEYCDLQKKNDELERRAASEHLAWLKANERKHPF